MSRAMYLHQRLRDECHEVLRRAQTIDLKPLRRCDLTLLRAELDNAKRLQYACGQVAQWATWRAALARVEAEIELRSPR